MPDHGPHVLVEMTNEPDCQFVAAWLTKAAEAEEYWSEALRDPDFSDRTLLLHVMGVPDLAAFALEIFGELEQCRHLVVVDLFSDEIGVLCSELALLVQLGFFAYIEGVYQMIVPEAITLAKVKQAAFDLLSTLGDAGDGIEVVRPERLMHLLAKEEAETSRLRLIEVRRFNSCGAPFDQTIQ